MSDEPTKAEVIKSVEPDSTQINAEDLLSGPQTFTVAGVKRGSKEQPIQIELVGMDRFFRPCKTVRRVLIALWSDEPAKWVGQRLTLYTDEEVRFGGIKCGGLRVSHATGIDNPRTFMLTQARGKKAEVTIRPIGKEQAKSKPEPAPELPAGKHDDFAMLSTYIDDAKSETRLDQIAKLAAGFRWSDATATKLADAIEQRRVDLLNLAAQEVAE